MTVTETPLPGVLLVEPRTFADRRGFFRETFHAARYAEHGLDVAFVQDNHSRSRQGVLRGLHFQIKQPQGKLIHVTRGRVFDAAVDLRRGSPTFGEALTVELDAEAGRQLWVPRGMAHGFCVLSDWADVVYRCDAAYAPGDEGGLRWDDPDLGIAWPIKQPVLSDKDAALPRLRDLPQEHLPRVAFEAATP